MFMEVHFYVMMPLLGFSTPVEIFHSSSNLLELCLFWFDDLESFAGLLGYLQVITKASLLAAQV